MKYVCQICATEYEVKNPSVIRKTNDNVKYIRCPKDNGYAFQEATTENMENKVQEAKQEAAKEVQNKAATRPSKTSKKKVETDDVKETDIRDKN